MEVAKLTPVQAFLQRLSTPLASAATDSSEANLSPLIREAHVSDGAVSLAQKTIPFLTPVVKAIPWRRLPLLCDFISFLLICLMLARTFLYIVKRRSGEVGPSMAPILIRFWAVYGAVQFLSQVLFLYLAPFQGQFLISCARAPLLLLLCYGRRLPISCHVYQEILTPVYEANEPEIEDRFQRVRATQSELDEAFRQLAVYLLQRMAVSGLSSLIPIPRFDTSPALSESDIPNHLRKRKEESSPLPQPTAVFPSSRNFFGAESDHRVRTVFAANRENLHGAIQPARASEMPTAAYDNLRAFRKQLRERFKKTASGKVAPG